MSGVPVILAAGGTGGHLFPAEALARELIRRGRAVTLVTDRRGGQFPVAGVPTYRIPAGRSGRGLAAKVKGAIDVARGIFAARRLLARLEARSVVGFGGYASLPTLLAAVHMGLPTVIHDSNAVLGRANRLLAGRVTRIATAFPSVSGIDERTRAKVVDTGNPVRPAVQALRNATYEAPGPGGEVRLLVIGGSQGARILSRVVPSALLSLPPELRSRLRVSQQVRREDGELVALAYEGSGLQVEARPFFEDLPARLGAAHLVVCRAGGSTVAELTVAGRPAILVPFAGAIADEQTANAQELVERGAAWLLPEGEFTTGALAALLAKLLADPVALARAAAEAHALGQPEAARALADLVETAEREAAR
jgi:UDP-N-acetylglucosamine--N-acetylmuramyl-(pentapeptide) pyrophosphoryl-undecaprenol N-acetylglucosamine transferase